MAEPAVKIQIGRQNIRQADVSSAADLGRALKEAFTQFSKDLGWFTDQLERVLPEDLMAALEPTFEISQGRVPVKTGELKESGYLEQVPFRNGVRVEMGYGRNNVPDYAVLVHEGPQAHAPPTSNKYLQGPIDEDYYNIIQRVTDRLKARTGVV